MAHTTFRRSWLQGAGAPASGATRIAEEIPRYTAIVAGAGIPRV